MKSFTAFLQNHMMECFFVKHFGIECPGCGMQRSYILLLQGQFSDSIKMYPALLPMIFLFCFLLMHLIFKFKFGAAALKWNFIIVVSIMWINYLIKMISIIHI